MRRDGYFLEDRPGAGGGDARLAGRLLGRLRPHAALLGGALLCLLLGTACLLAGPWILKVAVDRHLVPRRPEGLLPLGALYLAAVAGGALFSWLQALLVSAAGNRAVVSLREEAFARLQRLPVAWFDRTPSGRVMTRITSDVDAIQELVSSGLVSTAGDALLLLGTAALLLSLSVPLALAAFAVLPALLLFSRAMKGRLREANRESRRKTARLSAYLQERLTGMAVVKAFSAEEREEERFRRRNDECAAEALRLTRLYSFYFPGVEFLASVTTALVLWRGGVLSGEGGLTAGALVAFLEYARRFFDPLKDMSDKYNLLQGALASAERIFDLLDTAESPEYGIAPPPPSPAGGGASAPRGRAGAAPYAVEFRDVWFSYPARPAEEAPGGTGAAGEAKGTEPVLSGLSFRLRPGERGALVGVTGAGKSTVLSLLCRFFEPDRGEILLFGERVRSLDASELRRRVSLVLQEPFLFPGTIRQNVGLGGERVEEAARATGLAAFASAWERGLDTEGGEGGSRLSVGQRQLACFARALARDPDLLLLDEATASVDPATERAVNAAMEAMTQGRTTLVVAHRLATILSADRILVLHRGKLREEGSHGELLAKGGLYRRLWDLQFRDPP